MVRSIATEQRGDDSVAVHKFEASLITAAFAGINSLVKFELGCLSLVSGFCFSLLAVLLIY